MKKKKTRFRFQPRLDGQELHAHFPRPRDLRRQPDRLQPAQRARVRPQRVHAQRDAQRRRPDGRQELEDRHARQGDRRRRT